MSIIICYIADNTEYLSYTTAPSMEDMLLFNWFHHSLYANNMVKHRHPVMRLSPLHWRHNGRDSVSNHQPRDCLLYRLFRRRSKKTSELRATGLCAGNSPGTGEFPAQMASYAEKVSIWWRHHVHINHPDSSKKKHRPHLSVQIWRSRLGVSCCWRLSAFTAICGYGRISVEWPKLRGASLEPYKLPSVPHTIPQS